MDKDRKKMKKDMKSPSTGTIVEAERPEEEPVGPLGGAETTRSAGYRTEATGPNGGEDLSADGHRAENSEWNGECRRRS